MFRFSPYTSSAQVFCLLIPLNSYPLNATSPPEFCKRGEGRRRPRGGWPEPASWEGPPTSTGRRSPRMNVTSSKVVLVSLEFKVTKRNCVQL